MTCAVGYIKKGVVTIGVDNLASTDALKEKRKDHKITQNGEMIIAWTGSYRMGQLLQYSLKPPKHPKKMPTHEYMATLFVDAVRDCLKTGGYAERENEVESGGTFLVGYRGVLFTIYRDYQVSIPADNFAAIGSGMYFALGALYDMKNSIRYFLPGDYVLNALKAAAYFDPYVSGPFKIMRLLGKTK